MKILVTGGSGFIATNLLINLKKSNPDLKLFSIDNRPPTYPVEGVNYILGDIENDQVLKNKIKNVDKIYHFAAAIGTHESFENVTKVCQTNILGTINILELVKANPKIELFIAGMPGIWNNPYSISKDAAFKLAISYQSLYKLKICGLRFFSVYGEYQYVSRFNKAVPTFIDQAINGDNFTVYGDGNQKADYIYVQDVVKLSSLMLEKKNWGTFIECGTGVGTSVRSLIHIIKKICSSQVELVNLTMRAGEPLNSSVKADVKNFKNKFPGFEFTPLLKGLDNTVLWYKNNKILD
jgi:UDP-glucose 4-epimerase